MKKEIKNELFDSTNILGKQQKNKPLLSNKTQHNLYLLKQKRKNKKYDNQIEDLSPEKETQTNLTNTNSSTPTISKATQDKLEKIKMLKASKDQKLESKSENSENLFSKSFIYSEIIYDYEIKYVLPPKYLYLLKQFEELDNLINLFKSLNKPLKYSDIIKSSKRLTDISDFQKMLYVAPHLFTYKYFEINSKNKFLFVNISNNNELITKSKNPSLFINLNYDSLQTEYSDKGQITKEELKDRSQEFKVLLIHITLAQHLKLIKKFNPIKSKTWHHQFNLEEVDDIPETKLILLEKYNLSNSSKGTSTFNLIKGNIKNDFYHIDLDSTEVESDISNISKGSKLNKLSSEIKKKILCKDSASKSMKEIIQYNKSFHKKEPYKVEVLQALFEHFTLSKKKTIRLDEVLSQISRNNILSSLENKDLVNYIYELEKEEGLYTIIDHSELGKVIVLNEKNKDTINSVLFRLRISCD